jgi:regulator of cell morphogenesis and NO signaling
MEPFLMALGYDPIAVLMEEHQVFLRRLQDIRAELRRLSPRGDLRADTQASVAGFARFLAQDVDGFHGRKEEEGLFPALARHLGPEGGPVEVMLQDHEVLRQHQSTIAGDATKLESDREATEAWSRVSAATAAVDELLTFHIDKEDRILFPMARELLSPAEMSEVALICREIEDSVDRGRSPARS